MSDNFFNPRFTTRRDYQTNAPSYYDFLAETNENFQLFAKDVEDTLNIDLVQDIVIASDANSMKLGKITKEELSTKRWKYTIQLIRDDFKENKLSNTDGTITIERLNDASTRISCDVDNVLKELTVKTSNNGIKVERDDNDITLSIDFDKVQPKLVTGSNVRIDENNVISVTKDATVNNRQYKFMNSSNVVRSGSNQYSFIEEAVTTDISAELIQKSGLYYVNTGTPNNHKGTLLVQSVKNEETFTQIFIDADDNQMYYRSALYSRGVATPTKYLTPWKQVGGTVTGNEHSWRGYRTILSPGTSPRYYTLKNKADSNIAMEDFSRFSRVGKDYQCVVVKERENVIYRVDLPKIVNGFTFNDIYTYQANTGKPIEHYKAPHVGDPWDGVYHNEKFYFAGGSYTIYVWDELTNKTEKIDLYNQMRQNNNANGSVQRIVGITGNPTYTNVIYFLAEDAKLVDGKPVLNAGDKLRIYSYTLDTKYLRIEAEMAKEQLTPCGFEFAGGRYYISYNIMVDNKADVSKGIETMIVNAKDWTILDRYTFKTNSLNEGTKGGGLTRWYKPAYDTDNQTLNGYKQFILQGYMSNNDMSGIFMYPTYETIEYNPITPLSLGEDKITVIGTNNVSGSSCIVVESLDYTALLDCGGQKYGKNGNYNKLKEYLTERDVKTIDTIYISHWDIDHINFLSSNESVSGGTSCLFDDFEVKTLICRPYDYDTIKNLPGHPQTNPQYYKDMKTLYDEIMNTCNKNGVNVWDIENYNIGNFACRVVAHYDRTEGEEGNYFMNYDSTGILISKGGTNGELYSYFYGGDLEGNDITRATYTINNKKIIASTLPHHGLSEQYEQWSEFLTKYGIPMASVTNSETNFKKDYPDMYNNMKKRYTAGLFWQGNGNITYNFTYPEDSGVMMTQDNNNVAHMFKDGIFYTLTDGTVTDSDGATQADIPAIISEIEE